MNETATLPNNTNGNGHSQFMRYVDLARRWKWYVAIALPGVTGLTLLAFFHLWGTQSELTAKALVGYEGESPILETSGASRAFTADHILTRRFLGTIVDSLRLRLIIGKRFNRGGLFDSISIDSAAAAGRYSFAVENWKRRYSLTFESADAPRRAIEVVSGPLSDLDTLSHGGIFVRFGSPFRRHPHEFSFSVASRRRAIDWLHRKMTVRPADPRRGLNYITIEVRGFDYPLAADIANTVAGTFVEYNLAFRKHRISGVLDNLSVKMETAERQLSKSEQAVSAYLERNQGVGLSQNADRIVARLIDYETGAGREQRAVDDANVLLQRLHSSSGLSRLQTAREAAVFLAQNGQASAAIISDNLRDAQSQLELMRRTHDSKHPALAQKESEISSLTAQIETSLGLFVQSARLSDDARDSAIRGLTGALNQLPRQELQLAKLRQRQQVDAQIYTTLFSRFNEAKVAEAAQVPDVYVMDYAVAPIAPAPLVRLLQISGIALLAGLAFAFAPPLLANVFDRSARCEADLRHALGVKFVESIPLISIRRGIATAAGNGGSLHKRDGVQEPDPHIIMACDQRNIANEFFRSLRTKIELLMQANNRRVLVFTSLDVNEGKSLITANTAAAFVNRGNKVLLMDADLRKGVQHDRLRVRKWPGLSDYLNAYEKERPELFEQILQPTPMEGLTVIASGPNPRNPVELLSLPAMRELVDAALKRFDVVLIDTPPLGVGADVASLHTLLCLYVVVVRSGRSSLFELKQSLSEYPAVARNVGAAVLNFSAIDSRRKYYKYRNYYAHI